MTAALTGLPARLKACRGVLVDSNVLLDIATDDPHWGGWRGRDLSEVAEHTTLIVNPRKFRLATQPVGPHPWPPQPATPACK